MCTQLSASQGNAHGLGTGFFLGTEPDGLLWTNYTSVLTNVGAALHGFHDVMKDISKHYSQKASIEHDLPTATQKLVTTNDCILSSAVALTNGAGKVSVP